VATRWRLFDGDGARWRAYCVHHIAGYGLRVYADARRHTRKNALPCLGTSLHRAWLLASHSCTLCWRLIRRCSIIFA